MANSNNGVSIMSGEDGPRFVIGVDYGTTYTGVAWVLTRGTGETPTLNEINVVSEWPDKNGLTMNAAKVPSLLTYSATTGQRWGYGIGSNAYVIRWTKLKLEKPTRLDALDGLHQILDEEKLMRFGNTGGPTEIPRHLIKTAEDIITEYLIKVAEVVRRDIERLKDPQSISDFPMDFVITHPAEWPEKGQNITFRAVNEAFEKVFPEITARRGNIYLSTEPEACAQFTMRDIVEHGHRTLRKGECFMVVDAGGGTVDLVSYLIEDIAPNFRVSKVTNVSGGPFGATRVDDYFLKTFLSARLGPDYNKLCPPNYSSGAHTVLPRGLQDMLTEFEPIKHRFAGPPQPGEVVVDNVLALPEYLGIQDNRASRIQDGNLHITWQDMVPMFEESVNGTLRRIQQQLVDVDRQGRRPGITTIFLSGGFSQSPYLFRRVREMAGSYGIGVLRGDDCWTAVAQGAVLMGLGVGCDIPPVTFRCPVHIGVVLSRAFTVFEHHPRQKYKDSFDQVTRAKSNISWVVAKGDLIAADTGIETSLKLIKKFTPNGMKTGRVQVVTSEYDGPGEPPNELGGEGASMYNPFMIYVKMNGILEMVKTGTDNSPRTKLAYEHIIDLDFDLSRIPNPGLPATWYRTETNTESGMRYNRVEMLLEMSIQQRGARLELVCGKVVDAMGVQSLEGYRLAAEQIPFL